MSISGLVNILRDFTQRCTRRLVNRGLGVDLRLIESKRSSR
jgi:hypothetical protein